MTLTKKIFTIVVMLLMIAVVGHWIRNRFFRLRPFVAEDVQFFLQDGREIVTTREKLERRRDGALHSAGTLYNPDGTSRASLGRVDFPDGRVAMIADSIRAKSTGKGQPAKLQILEGSFCFQNFNVPAQRAQTFNIREKSFWGKSDSLAS